MIEFILNDRLIQTELPSGSLLLDFIRYEQRLTGTKIGCREGDCGACTVLVGTLKEGKVDYRQITSCLTPLANVHGKHVVSVEGLNMAELSPVQQFMVDEGGTQCGFCTVGFVVSLTGYCLSDEPPSPAKAIAAVDGNICRCTGYKSIERAADRLTVALAEKKTEDSLNWLVEQRFLPHYFSDIPKRLLAMAPNRVIKDKRILIGGGTDLYVQRHYELADQEVAVVADQPDWRFIQVDDKSCTIGGGTTVTDIEESAAFQAHFPRLAEHIKLVSSSPIRNISTVAGNFVNASPIGDLTIFFLALDARITLSDDQRERTIFLKDFYQGYKTLDKTDNEAITAIHFNWPDAASHFNLEKVCKRIHLDIASVNSAAQIVVENGQIVRAHLSAGGVGPIPAYLHATCDYLSGKPLLPEHIRAANDIMQAEISPISDVRGTADYKRLLLRQLFYAHFVTLFPDQIALAALR